MQLDDVMEVNKVEPSCTCAAAFVNPSVDHSHCRAINSLANPRVEGGTISANAKGL
jgi:hypothetical protein